MKKNEAQATARMKVAHDKVCKKLRTKGRFQVEIPTNGL